MSSDPPPRAKSSDLGIPEGLGYAELAADPASGILAARFLQLGKPHHGSVWYRGFDEPRYRPLCGFPANDLHYRSALFVGPPGLLAVNIWVTARRPDENGKKATVGWDWHGLALYDLRTGEEVALVCALASPEATERLWISDLLPGPGGGRTVVANVGFEYPTENGSYVHYRLCEVSVDDGACRILTDLPAAFF